MKRHIATMLCIALVFSLSGCAASDYSKATKLIEAGDYKAAEQLLESMGEYKDSLELLSAVRNELNYQDAVDFLSNDEYEDAISLLSILGDYKDSTSLLVEAINGNDYTKGVNLFNEQQYSEAYDVFMKLSDFKDSNDRMLEIEERVKTDIVAKFLDACEYLKDFNQSNAQALADALYAMNMKAMYSGLSSALVDAKYIADDINDIIELCDNFEFASEVKYQCEKILPDYSMLANYYLTTSTVSSCHDMTIACTDATTQTIAEKLVPAIVDWNEGITGKTSNIVSYKNGYIPFYDSVIQSLSE